MIKKLSKLALLLIISISLSACNLLGGDDGPRINNNVIESHDSFDLAESDDGKYVMVPSADTITLDDWYKYLEHFSSLIEAGDISAIDYMRFIPDSRTNATLLGVYDQYLEKWMQTDLWKAAFKNFDVIKTASSDFSKSQDESWPQAHLRWSRANGQIFYELGADPGFVASHVDADRVQNLAYYNGSDDEETILSENDQLITDAYNNMQESDMTIIRFAPEILVWSDEDQAFVINGTIFFQQFMDMIPETIIFEGGNLKYNRDFTAMLGTENTPPRDLNVFYQPHSELLKQGRYVDLYNLYLEETEDGLSGIERFYEEDIDTERLAYIDSSIAEYSIPEFTNFPSVTIGYKVTLPLPMEINDTWYILPYRAEGTENAPDGYSTDKSNYFSFALEHYLAMMNLSENEYRTIDNFNNFNENFFE